jgi:protein involved in polysaccharide export with SLBB domain
MASRRTASGWCWGWNAEHGDLNPSRAAPLSVLTLIFFLFSLSFIPGALWAQDVVTPNGAAPSDAANGAEVDAGYRLGPGDHIHIRVHNQDDLSGEYVLDGTGRFSMPLIGTVVASGMTASGLENFLVSRLKPDYLVNPRIAVEVSNYRPYYIIGEVKNPSSYNYVQGMTYLTAIAIAGGYTYRAKKGVVYVIQGDDPDREETKMDADLKVQPGDIIRVAERLF